MSLIWPHARESGRTTVALCAAPSVEVLRLLSGEQALAPGLAGPENHADLTVILEDAILGGLRKSQAAEISRAGKQPGDGAPRHAQLARRAIGLEHAVPGIERIEHKNPLGAASPRGDETADEFSRASLGRIAFRGGRLDGQPDA